MLSADIATYLSKKPSQTSALINIQLALGFPRSKYGNVPETNPVNAALVAMRDNGSVTVTTRTWGEPIFTLKGPKP